MTPARQLAGLIAKFTPEIAALAHAALEQLRARLPGAVELVTDNDEGLEIAFAPGERASEAIFSISLFPDRVSLFFLQGAKLQDPKQLLQGSGKRHLVLGDAADLQMPGVRALITAALAAAKRKIDPGLPRRIVIQPSSKPTQRRRPPGKVKPAKKPAPARHPGRSPK